VVRVGIGDDDVDAARDAAEGAWRLDAELLFRRRGQHDDAVAQLELRVGDAAVFPRDQEMLLEAEGAAQELDGAGGVVVTQERVDAHGSSSTAS
jgi:hypothetical protein